MSKGWLQPEDREKGRWAVGRDGDVTGLFPTKGNNGLNQRAEQSTKARGIRVTLPYVSIQHREFRNGEWHDL